MIINLIKENRHNPFPETIKVLEHYRGLFSSDLEVVDKLGHTLAVGSHLLIECETEELVKWLHENQPVYVGTSPTPMLEQFEKWTDESYVPNEEVDKPKLNREHIPSKYINTRIKNSVPGSQKKKKKHRHYH